MQTEYGIVGNLINKPGHHQLHVAVRVYLSMKVCRMLLQCSYSHLNVCSILSRVYKHLKVVLLCILQIYAVEQHWLVQLCFSRYVLGQANCNLRWLKTVSSTFQDLEFDGSL